VILRSLVCILSASACPLLLFFQFPLLPPPYSFLGSHLRRRSCPPGRGSAPPRNHTCRVVRSINKRKGESQNKTGWREKRRNLHIHTRKQMQAYDRASARRKTPKSKAGGNAIIQPPHSLPSAQTQHRRVQGLHSRRQNRAKRASMKHM